MPSGIRGTQTICAELHSDDELLQRTHQVFKDEIQLNTKEETGGDETEFDGNFTDSTTASSDACGCNHKDEQTSFGDPTESVTEDDEETEISSHLNQSLNKGVRPLGSANVPELAEDTGTAWKVAEDAMEGAVDGLVAFATELAGSVARGVAAVEDVAVAAFGETTDIEHSADSMEAASAALRVGSLPFGDQAWDLLSLSMPLKPSDVVGVEAAKHRSRTPSSRTSSLRHIPTAASTPTVATPKPRLGKRVAIVVNGSEGDVRPLVALARALVDNYQHIVRILTNLNLVHLCIRHGIDAVPVFADSRSVIQNCGGLSGSFLEAVKRPAKVAEKWMREHKGEYIMVDEALENFDPNAIIVGAQAVVAALRYEQAKHVPSIPVFLSRPWLEEEAFNFVADKLPPRPSFYAVSEAIDRKSLPCKTMMKTGAWVLHEMPTAEDLAPNGALHELKEFLEAGPPPVAVGWGSMMAEGMTPADMLELALRALLHAGKRGVVLGGWAELDRMASLARAGRLPSRSGDGGKLAAFAAKEVCFVSSAPHEWLFPQCCCVIHHGGVGTTHAALRAGKPSVVTPVCADQFNNAEIVQQLKAGIGFKEALPSLSVEAISRGVRFATEDIMTLQAEILGRKMRREENQALAKAAGMLDGFLRGRVKLRKGQWVRLTGPAKKVPRNDG